MTANDPLTGPFMTSTRITDSSNDEGYAIPPAPEGAAPKPGDPVAARRNEPMSTEAPEFTAGQEVTWTGAKGLFSRRVRIIAPRRSYLQIFGETPEDARLTYDVADPTIKGTVYGIPPEQLHAVPEEG